MKTLAALALLVSVIASTTAAGASQKKASTRHQLRCETHYVLGGSVTTCK